MIQYQVVGACAHATVNTAQGRQRQLHPKGTLLPPDVPAHEIDHLLSVGLVAPVAGLPPVAVAEPEVTPPVGTTSGDGPADAGHPDAVDQPSEGAEQPSDGQAADPDVEARRAEARAKLPTDGSIPDGRMGQPVFVEYLAGKGYAYEALAKEDKPTLVEMAKSLQQ